MRLMAYNIRYGTGHRRRLPWSGYLGRTTRSLDEIIRFIRSFAPDIVGLLEVDAGSYRSGMRNQAETIAEAMGHYHTYRSKYADSTWARALPLMNKQGNALLAKDTIKSAQFHYFDRGVKRLVMELETETMTVFLVHLALTFRIRHHQLSDLYSIVKTSAKPVVVAGDFNSRWGDREISLFLAATGLRNANAEGLPSYPSWAPKRQLDFILHSPEIELERFMMPPVTLSDHLPLICDFRLADETATTGPCGPRIPHTKRPDGSVRTDS